MSECLPEMLRFVTAIQIISFHFRSSLIYLLGNKLTEKHKAEVYTVFRIQRVILPFLFANHCCCKYSSAPICKIVVLRKLFTKHAHFLTFCYLLIACSFSLKLFPIPTKATFYKMSLCAFYITKESDFANLRNSKKRAVVVRALVIK